MLDRLEDDFEESLKVHLAALNQDLDTAREYLTHYEVQVGRQN